MSSAPSDTTCGMPAFPADSSRSGTAASTPPATWSQNSVVVTSSDPTANPAARSFSIEPPPAPVWWKTSTS